MRGRGGASAASPALPVRGAAVRGLGLPLPAPGRPAAGRGSPRMPLARRGRPLKRWRYVGAFGPEVMLCAGEARVGPVPQRWWAVAERGAPLVERTSLRSPGLVLEPAPGGGAPGAARVRVDVPELRLELLVAGKGSEPVEVASPAGGDGWIWTRKRAGVPARGELVASRRSRTLELEAVVDDSAGYHERRTAWRWSAGVGRALSGERLAWNLVRGVHDSDCASERTVWIAGEPREVGAVTFAPDLSRVDFSGGGSLGFTPWGAREHRTNLLLLRSSYRQPFGTFAGDLPGGLRLAEGYGVMEEHDARW